MPLFGAAFAATEAGPDQAACITAHLREVLVGEGDQATGTLGGMLQRARGTPEAGPAWGCCLRRSPPGPLTIEHNERWLANALFDLWIVHAPAPPGRPPDPFPESPDLPPLTTAWLEGMRADFEVRKAPLDAEPPPPGPRPRSRIGAASSRQSWTVGTPPNNGGLPTCPPALWRACPPQWGGLRIPA